MAWLFNCLCVFKFPSLELLCILLCITLKLFYWYTYTYLAIDYSYTINKYQNENWKITVVSLYNAKELSVWKSSRNWCNGFSFYPSVWHHVDMATGCVPSLMRVLVIGRYRIFQKYLVEQLQKWLKWHSPGCILEKGKVWSLFLACSQAKSFQFTSLISYLRWFSLTSVFAFGCVDSFIFVSWTWFFFNSVHDRDLNFVPISYAHYEHMPWCFYVSLKKLLLERERILFQVLPKDRVGFMLPS